MSSDLSLAPTGRNSTRTSHFCFDAAQFAADFDQRPFYLEHDLQSHPLLQLPAMAALSQRLDPFLVEWNSGGGAYGKADPAGMRALNCKDAILSAGQRSVWVLLRQVEHDPPYRALLDQLLDEARPYSEPVRPGMYQREAFLFISSRAAVTPYHFDPEHNFLLQVRGRKTVHMWDAANRVVMPQAALDTFYANVRSNRDQPYRDEFMASAWVLPLSAGQGVHFPLHAPHWVKTESDVSISLSITFRSRHSKFCAGVHCANDHLRRLGIMPPAPGVHRLWDVAAQLVYVADRRLRSLVDRVRRWASLVQKRFAG